MSEESSSKTLQSTAMAVEPVAHNATGDRPFGRTDAVERLDFAQTARSRTRKRLLKGGIWVAVLRFVGIGLAFVVNAVLARSLTKDVFGNFVWFSSLLTLAGCIARMGMERLIPRFVAESVVHRDVRNYYGAFRKGSIVALGSTLSLALAWSVFLYAGGLKYLALPLSPVTIILTSATMIIGSMLLIASESFRGLHRLFEASLFSAEASGPLIAALLLGQFLIARCFWQIDFLGSLSILFLSMAIPTIAAVVLLIKAIQLSAPSAGGPAGIPLMAEHRPQITYRQLLAAGFPIMLTQFFAMTCMFSDMWIAKICCNEEQLAYMGASRRLALMISLPMTITNLTITGAIPTLYAERDLHHLQSILQRAALVGCIPSIIAVAALNIAPGLFLGILYGPAYTNAAPLVATMALGFCSLCWAGAAELTLTLTGKQRISMVVSVAAGFATPIAGYLVATRDNAWPIAAASAVVLAARSLAMWWLTYQTVGVWTHPAVDSSILRKISFRPSISE